MISIELKAPMAWGELTKEQLLVVAETLGLLLTREERLVTLFCQLARVGLERHGKSWHLVHGKVKTEIKTEEIAEFSGRFAWIIDSQPKGVANPTAADDFIRDMTFGDWFEADTQFMLYEEDDDGERFNVILPLLKETHREMTRPEMTAYKWWWWSVQDTLAETYPNVFKHNDSGGDLVQYNPFKTLQDFHLLLNDNHPQENERIDASNVHDALSAIDNKIAEIKQKQEAYRKIVTRL